MSRYNRILLAVALGLPCGATTRQAAPAEQQRAPAAQTAQAKPGIAPVARAPAHGVPAVGGKADVANPSFDGGLDSRGLPQGWEGSQGRLKLVEVGRHGEARGHALLIAKGGFVSQTVPATGGLHYSLTVLAHTPLVPEPESSRYRSACYLELTFLPTQEKHRVEMVSPFGDSRRFVEHSVGGQAPAGTNGVRIAVSAQGGELTVDDVRLVPHQDSYTHFTLKPQCLDTVIAAEGQARARIVVPESGRYDALAGRIAGRIRQLTGADVPVVRDSAFDLCRDQRLDGSLIVLGNRSTNRVVSDLYDLYHCILDLRYPGQGGSVVRSLHSPFGDGHNVLLVGASDEEGMNEATAAFIGAIEEAAKGGKHLTLGYLARIELGRDVKIPETMTFAEIAHVKPWDATGGTGGYGWTVITKCLAFYYLSGHPFYAREFLRLAFPQDEQTRQDLLSAGQDFAGDRREPLVDVYHYRAHLPVVYWDLVEESPMFSNAERTRVTQAFMKQVKTYRSNKDYGCAADKTLWPVTCLSDRHTQWGAMTFYTLGRYLAKDYPDYEWRAVKRGAENSLAPIHLKRHIYNRAEQDKLERYPTTVAALFAYTLMSGNKAPVQVGSLQEQARGRIEMLLDWREDAWVLSQAPTSLFNQMAYLFRDARYLRMRDLRRVPSDVFRPGQSYWPDEAALEPAQAPSRQWDVLRLTPEERAWWAEVWQQPLEPTDRMFRLCSYRTANDPRGDFLLFEGIHAGGVHKCFALVEHILNGDVLFMGARTHLNTMSDGMTATRQPRFSVLERAEANGRSALIEARVPDYNGLDWKRSVLHRQGQYTLFLDTLTSQQNSAAASVEINWALAHNAHATSCAPGCAVIQVVGGGSPPPLYRLNALSSPGVRFKASSSQPVLQRSEHDALVLRSPGKGESLEVGLDLERDLDGYLVAEVLRLPSGGLFRLELDGGTLAPEISAWSPRTETDATLVDLCRQQLNRGSHVIRLVSLGPAPQSSEARVPFRGFRVLGRPATTEYVLCLSSKIALQRDALGSVIGSVESGDTLAATWNGPLGKGETLRLFSLVAAKPQEADAAAGNCLALGPNAAALALSTGHAIAAVGEWHVLRADLGVMAADHLVAYGATRAGELLASDSPVDVDWSFSSGTLAINCPRQSAVTVALAGAAVKVDDRPTAVSQRTGNSWTLTLDAGRHVVSGAQPRASLLEGFRGRLTSAFEAARAARLQAPVVGDRTAAVTAPAIKPTWQAPLGDFPFDMRTFRSGNEDRVAVAAGKNILLFDAAGTLLRKLEADDVVRVVHYWPEAGVLAAGCRDFRVIAFDPASGRRRWAFQSTDINPEYKRSGTSGWFDRSPVENKGVHALASGVFLDGRSQLLVGTASTVEALNEDGKLLRSMNAGVGVVTDIALLDCGAGEVRLFPARLFGHSRLQHTSSRTPDKSSAMFVGPFTPRRGVSTYVSNICNGYAAIAAVDLDGDGRQELAGLFNGTLNGIHVWDRAGEVLADAAFGPGAASPRPSWQKRLSTPNMRGLAIADLDGDGRKELCVITARGFAIVLNHRCVKLWARALPSDPTAVAVFGAEGGHPGRLVVACRSGAVYVLDASSEFLAQGQVDGVPARMVRLSDSAVALATAEGQAAAYRVR